MPDELEDMGCQSNEFPSNCNGKCAELFGSLVCCRPFESLGDARRPHLRPKEWYSAADEFRGSWGVLVDLVAAELHRHGQPLSDTTVDGYSWEQQDLRSSPNLWSLAQHGKCW